MNQNDLRVIKTEESIQAALFELLHEKPLAKITVTELSRVARINKGTFYRHYLDVFDLYDKTVQRVLDETVEEARFFNYFFDSPRRFLTELDRVLMSNLQRMRLLQQGKGEGNLREELMNRLRERIYQTGHIEACVQNDIRLDAVFGALLSFMPKYYITHREEAIEVSISLIDLFFGDVRTD